jgi:TatD DNase family protein
MSALSQKTILDLASQYKSIFPALGIHPEEVKMNKKIEVEIDSICELITSNKSKLCAIGEIGLDHHFIKDKRLYPLQYKIFTRMLSLAQELSLPVNLHTKGAEKLLFDTLPSYNLPNVNIHWYSGPEEYLKLGVDREYYFSITPAIKYSPAVKRTASFIDKEHLLLESDGPVKYSGKVGTPAMIKEVIAELSLIKKINLEHLEATIFENTRKIFPRLFIDNVF